MTELRSRMKNDMTLYGYSEKTQKSYIHAVKCLSQYYNRSPDKISEEEVRRFFLHLLNERNYSRSYITISLCGIKFFYEKTLKRQWRIFKLVRPQNKKKLPIVLTIQEVRRILSLINIVKYQIALKVIYSCGLRLSEGINLKVADINSERMIITVRNGKGGKDRNVPLPERTLHLLREYWKLERPKQFLYPSNTNTVKPISMTTLQCAFKAALKSSGIQKSAVIHTLRHSYATHLLQYGVDLRVIQEILGHKSPKTTAIYTHISSVTINSLNSKLNQLMKDL